MAERVVYRPVRRKLPDERRSITHKFSIGGHEGYITVGMYDDGAPGEIFITMANWEPHEPLILRVGYLLDSGNRSGIGLVGRPPWTAANASSACWQASQGAGGGRGRPPHIAPQNVGYLSQADTLILRFFWSRYPTSFAKREPGRTMV